MDRKSLLKQFIYEEERIAFSKALDQAYLAVKTFNPAFTCFMDPVKAEKIQSVLGTLRELDCRIIAYGGSPDCERVKLGFFPDHEEAEIEAFPIDAIKINKESPGSSLDHRDYLGALIGLGIDRSRVGDIFVKPDGAVVFTDRAMSAFIIGNLRLVGRYRVTLFLLQPDEVFVYQIPEAEKNINVSSLRLDNVLSGAFRLSRGRSAELISKDKAFINWRLVSSPSKTVGEGDVLTLRGYGRVKVKEIVGKTKKDKIRLTLLSNQ